MDREKGSTISSAFAKGRVYFTSGLALALLCLGLAGGALERQATAEMTEEIIPPVAFSYDQGVMTIAEGTRVLGQEWDWAGRGGTIKPHVMVLPASLEEIANTYMLMSFAQVQEYRVAEGNQHFKAVDGVLYTLDGKQLIAFPPGKGGTFHMPDGVEEIIWGTFDGNRTLQEIIFSEGLRQVEIALLHGFWSLEAITLPSTFEGFVPYDYSPYTIVEIRVAEGNPTFMDIDGVLFNRDGVLVQYPWGRKDAYYQVPQGTKIIGEYAFQDNVHIASVALPRGLARIEKLAFNVCSALTSISLPVTLEAIGEYAFADCVNLSRCAVPAATELGKEVFYNCPKLVAGAGAEAIQAGVRSNSVYALLSPEDARDTVPLYQRPDSSSPVLVRYPSGATVQVTQQEGNYFLVRAVEPYGGGEASQEYNGYVEASQLQMCGYLHGLFTVAQVAPPGDGKAAELFESMWTLLEAVDWRRSLEMGEVAPVREQWGQWYELDYPYWDYYVLVNEVTVYAEAIPPGKTYGVVVNRDLRDRLHLREKPQKGSASLGKYFSGTQVDILGEEGDFYKVRLGFGQEGYMMKQYVQVVEEVPHEP